MLMIHKQRPVQIPMLMTSADDTQTTSSADTNADDTQTTSSADTNADDTSSSNNESNDGDSSSSNTNNPEQYGSLSELVDDVKNGDIDTDEISLNDFQNSGAYQGADQATQDCIDLAGKIGGNLIDYEIVRCSEDVNHFKNQICVIMTPTVMRTTPTVMRTTPTVMRTTPTVMRTTPTVMRTTPTITMTLMVILGTSIINTFY